MALRLIKCTTIFQRRSFIIQQCREQKYKKTLICSYNNALYSTKAELKTGTGWTSWRTITTRFVPIGICLIAVMQWRAYRRLSSGSVAKDWQIKLYCSLPLRGFSRCWGWFAELKLPVFIRPWIYGMYTAVFQVNLDEAESSDLTYYPSLADFFARGLKENSRTINFNSCITSPCDGKVLHCGPVLSNNVEQVKGVTYSLEKFLGDTTWKDSSSESNNLDYRLSLLEKPDNKPSTLYQCVIYLAPGDYHRFHSPAEWEPNYRRHFHGELLSVSPKLAHWIPGLFVLNERAVYLGHWQHGFFSFTAVGATNVGSMKVYFDPTLQTNLKKNLKFDCAPANMPLASKNCVRLKRGDPVGEFRMGSTIVMLFEAPSNFEFHLKPGQHVRMGQSIGCFRERKYVDNVQKPNYTVIENVS